MTDIISKRKGRILVCVFVLCFFLTPQAEALDVHEVVGLVQAGVDDDTIMAIVKKTGSIFVLSEEERQALKAAGASERLIVFLVNPSAVSPPLARTRPLKKTEHGASLRSKKSIATSASSSPTQPQNFIAGLGQGTTQGPKELWQGDWQGSRSRPAWQSPTVQSQGGIRHPQVLEIPPVQAPSERTLQTLTAIPSRAQEGIREQPAHSREAMVTITVTDREGAYITGLRPEEVRVYEDGMLQEILSLTPDQHTPVSVGILLDTSGSMIDKLDEAKDGLRHFVNTLQREDEVFLFVFSDAPRLVQDFTSDQGAFVWTLDALRANGSTALYEVIAAGLTKIREGRHRKKALLLITDGKDTIHGLSLDQVMEMAKRSDVLLYSLGIGHGERGSFGHLGVGWPGDEVDVAVLQALSGATGGAAFIIQGAHVVDGVDVIDQACQRIAAELRLQYTLRYRSASRASAGEWHSLRVESPRRDLNVRARSGSHGE